MARDGTTLTADYNEFGQEWQVLEDEPKLFQGSTSLVPQSPTKCFIPAVKAGRRLGESLATATAEAACSIYDGYKKDMCVFDVVAMGDLEIAEIHGAF